MNTISVKELIGLTEFLRSVRDDQKIDMKTREKAAWFLGSFGYTLEQVTKDVKVEVSA